MSILLRLLIWILGVAAIMPRTSAAETPSRKLYWSEGAWQVAALPFAPGGPLCAAVREFTSTQDAGQAAAWGFTRTIGGRWDLFLMGARADEMVGQAATISVDGRALHRATAFRHGTAVGFGALPAVIISPIANGKWLSIDGAFRSVRFHLANAEAALGATHRCSLEQTAAAEKRVASTAPPPAERKAPEQSLGGYGTGFFVSATGHILTNAHVVRNCSTIHVTGDRVALAPAALKGADATHDLALLELPKPPPPALPVLPWREDVPLGGQVAVFGFPYFGTYAATGTFTRGDVTALAGLAGNSAHLQISAPIQPGNSGGPVGNEQGQVVGVVVGRLSSAHVVQHTGDLPQNVNFAIKSAQARSFLQVHGLSVPAADPRAPALSGPDLAARLKAAAVLVVCRGG